MGGASSVAKRTAEPKTSKGYEKDIGGKKEFSPSKNSEREEVGSSITPNTSQVRPSKNPNHFHEKYEDRLDHEENSSPYESYSLQNSPEQSYEDSPHGNDSVSEAQARMNEDIFAHTAMSLEMDNDDLLFNLLYFENNSANLGRVINSMQEETVALHSDSNTPYKLKPASEKGLANLPMDVFTENTEDKERECAICKDDLEYGDDITRIRSCKHYFHKDCLIRWAKLQGWCPVCRASIDDNPENMGETKDQNDDFGIDSRSTEMEEYNEKKAVMPASKNELSAALQRKPLSHYIEAQDLNSNDTISKCGAHDVEMDMTYDELQDDTRIIASSMTDMYLGTPS